MNQPCICILAEENREPAPECELPKADSPGCGHWRETTLRRLEAWIEERERLIAEIERRIEQETIASPTRSERVHKYRHWIMKILGSSRERSIRSPGIGAIKD